MEKQILDACCGSRMFWFDKEHPAAVFMDNRSFAKTLCDGWRSGYATLIYAKKVMKEWRS